MSEQETSDPLFYRINESALAGETGASEADIIDPEAWAALLKASGVPTDNYQGLTIEWTVLREWRIRFSLEGMASSCEARARNINQAIRAAVAQAEGREGQK